MAIADIQDRWNHLLRITRSWRLEWNLPQLLGRIAHEAVEFLELERGVIYLLDADGLEPHATWPPRLTSGTRLVQQSRKIAQDVVRSGRPLFAHVLEDEKSENKHAGVLFCVPMTASRGILGALYVDSRSRTAGFSQQDQEFLEMLGLQAAVALENALLYQSAITDPLTGLYSHRHFQQEVEQSVRQAQRSGDPVSLLILDLDHFKQLNDTCGHETGNKCLKQVAAILRETLRGSDILARFGGDEFEVLLSGTGAADAVKVAEKLREKIGALKFPKKRRVTGTIGIAEYPGNAGDAQSLFLRADEALYEAKENGRNQVIRSKVRAKSRSPRALRGKVPPKSLKTAPSAQLAPAAAGASSNAAELIDGYPLIRRLGAGSSGEVLLVRQPELSREIALKRPLTPHLTPEQIEAFEREAKITASLSHPGVVTVHGIGTDSDARRYYTMKPLNGSSLAQVLEARRSGNPEVIRKYTLARMLEILQRVGETISYAHNKSICHLDLTPSNVVIGEFGEVTVIDWGVGASSFIRKRAQAKPSGSLVFLAGSPGWIAPEQLPSSSVSAGPPADVHAMGTILYEILTGQSPYRRADTRETLHALLNGDIVPPEKLLPRAGIDPVLSALCMDALRPRPEERPSATQFTERLSRFVRRETDFSIIRFGDGPGEHPLVPDEWLQFSGMWRIENGAWVSTAPCDQLLYWKAPVPGSFRLICECWAEPAAELALFCRQFMHERFAGGQGFQFGAEWNTCTKMYKGAAIQGMKVEEGRHYRMELEFQEGWLYCYLDGKKIFEHRELFDNGGQHLAFYTCSYGAHFKPIEIQSQSWGLSVPVMSMADKLFQLDQYASALEIYRDVAERMCSRLEGLEAQLKAGMCLFKLKDYEGAQASFLKLHGTQLEPHALLEQAMMEIYETHTDDFKFGMKTLDILFDKYPNNPVLLQVGISNLRNMRPEHYYRTRRQRLDFMAAMAAYPRRASSTPTISQIYAGSSRMFLLAESGNWQQAFDEIAEFSKSLIPEQRRLPVLGPSYYGAALAIGREDILPDDPFHLSCWDERRYHVALSLGFQIAARKGCVPEFIARLEAGKRPPFSNEFSAVRALMNGYAWQGEYAKAEKLLENYREIVRDGWVMSELLQESFPPEVLLPSCESLNEAERPDLREVLASARMRKAFEARDFAAAAKIYSTVPQWQFQRYMDSLPLVVMLHALGAINVPEIVNSCEQRIAGTRLDLVEMALGRREPLPGKLWPHPLFKPEWRLWLALFLEAKGMLEQAYAVAAPVRDQRFGKAHCQPQIEALLARTAKAQKPAAVRVP